MRTKAWFGTIQQTNSFVVGRVAEKSPQVISPQVTSGMVVFGVRGTYMTGTTPHEHNAAVIQYQCELPGCHAVMRASWSSFRHCRRLLCNICQYLLGSMPVRT